ncbi:hypothetical protein THAOC_26663 [Thalassiosira oceanica]|uniref:Uncharacterized protein n=1 Tax=Thalassiosira oceanica TaxID=159749 RepID=K0RNJ3_THAOC|nr:hypothetical protein THAOC_26663 [Thalassiosira oceanica]|eukprot:EJK53819.1 hypothetical protein THAOC_26663 [Thalassiosira oceanica]
MAGGAARSLGRAALLAALCPVRSDDPPYFGLYHGSVVLSAEYAAYAELDADVSAIDSAVLSTGSLSSGGPATSESLDLAYGIYASGVGAADGGEADEGDGTGTIWQLANREHIDLPDATTARFFSRYYGMEEWADRWLEAAYKGEETGSFANGTADFSAWSSGQGLEARADAFGYGALILVFWPHVVASFEIAYDGCTEEGGAGPNAFSLGWWDRAVALYGGSEVMSSMSEGSLLYALANDMSKSFGVESINANLFGKFSDGRRNLVDGDCDAVRTDLEEIISLMLVPLIQGSLRAMQAVDAAGGNAIEDGGGEGADMSGASALGQAAAFGAIMLPMVHDCSPGNAAIVYRDMVPGGGPGDGSYAVVRAALERCYRKFDVKCDWVGGVDGSEPCDDAVVSMPPPEPLKYTPTTDVERWAGVDESVRVIRSKLTRKDQEGLEDAYAAYDGEDVKLGDSYSAWRLAVRQHIQLDKSFTEKFFNEYYGVDTWTDDWVEAAYLGQETTTFERSGIDFSTSSWTIEKRSTAFEYGILTLVLWQYVVGSLEMATYKCDEYDGDPARSLPHWDQAVALYAGSAVLDDPEGAADRGHLLYTLANEECYYFGRCREGEDSPSNVELFRMFNDGQRQLELGNCEAVDGLLAEMVPQLLVPLIQGAIRTTFILDEYPIHSPHVDGRAAAFYSALVPLIEDCSPGDGEFLEENMILGKRSSFGYVRGVLEQCYDDLEVTCEMIGGLLDNKFTGYVVGGEACGGVEPVPGILKKPNPVDFRVPASSPTSPSAPSSFSKSAQSAGGGNELALAMGLTALCATFVTLCAYVVVKTNKPRDGPASRAASPQLPVKKRVLKFSRDSSRGQEGVPPREMFVGGNGQPGNETASISPSSSKDYANSFAEKEAQLAEIEQQIAGGREIV